VLVGLGERDGALSHGLDNLLSTYRSDIDGLRAFAVLAVIVNHADPGALASGFLGVDIFFVISGYVITLSLLAHSDQPLRAFLQGFYRRRIKRLMPALILCVAVSSLVILQIDPEPTVSLETGAAALFGFANIYLYVQQLDYFATDIGFNAFTHTWSLGIEEQFYLLLPVLFWFGCRARLTLFLFVLIALVSGVSYGAFLVLRESYPVSSFYLLHTRFWELGAGVGLALLQASRLRGGELLPISGWWIGWQGLFLVGLVCSLAVEEPGGAVLSTLVVVLTMMVIAAPDRSWLLQNTVTVYLGRISYSLYLWHWPLLVFERLAPDQLWTSPLALMGLLFGASIMSYHFVEQPLRHRHWSVKQRWDLWLGLSVSGVLAVGLVLAPKSGAVLSSKPVSEAEPVLEARHMALERPTLPLPMRGEPHDPTCVVDDGRRPLRDDTFERCTFPPEPGRMAPMVWVIGDSHAGHFQGLLVQLHAERGMGFHLVETVSQVFPPMPGGSAASRLGLLDRMRAQMQPGDIVLLSRLYLTRSDPVRILPDVTEHWLPALPAFLEEMSERSVRVIVSGPPPVFQFGDLRSCQREDLGSCAVARAPLAAVVDTLETSLRVLAERHDNLRVLPVFDILCPEDRDVCSPLHERVFTMRDRDHMNVYGASLLKERFWDVLTAR
jgi:peptidoglycan/LPS O-acetylase OafA/YrhL